MKRVRPGACAPGGVVGRRSRSRISERCRYGDARAPDTRRRIISGGWNSSSSRPGATRSSRKRFRVRAARAAPNYLDVHLEKLFSTPSKDLAFASGFGLGALASLGEASGAAFSRDIVFVSASALVDLLRRAESAGRANDFRRRTELPRRGACADGRLRCRPPAEKRESPTSAQPWISVLLRSSPIADIWSCAASAKARAPGRRHGDYARRPVTILVALLDPGSGIGSFFLAGRTYWAAHRKLHARRTRVQPGVKISPARRRIQ